MTDLSALPPEAQDALQAKQTVSVKRLIFWGAVIALSAIVLTKFFL